MLNPEPDATLPVPQFQNLVTPQVRRAQSETIRFVGYVRVSTDRQAEMGFGIEVQERAIRSWVKTNGHRLVAITKDEGQSGSNGLEGRVGLADALDALRAKQADGVVVYRLDRLARDLVLQEQLIAELRHIPAQLHSTAPGESEYLRDDPSDPSRALIRQVLGAVAQYERAMIRMRMAAGKRRKQEAGRKWVGAYAYGFVGAGVGRDRDAAFRDDEQAAIRRMLELRASGASYRVIATALDREGFRPRRAGSWSSAVVRRIILRAEQSA